MDEISCSPAVLGASEAIQVVLAQMQITSLQSIAVEEVTRGQHKNPLWSLHQKGRLTSSNFGLVLKPCLTNRAERNSTMERLLGNDSLSSVRAVKWGIQHEAIAIKAYIWSKLGIRCLHPVYGCIRQESLEDLPMALYRQKKLLKLNVPFRDPKSICWS